MKHVGSQFNFIIRLALPLQLCIFLLAPAPTFAIESTEVVVARGFIKKGQVIRDADLSIEEKKFYRMPADIFQDTEHILNKTARRDIRSGAVIRKGLLDTVKLVKRGEPVTIIAESEALRITAVGRAMEDGDKGRYIKVLNLGSKKVITGKVTAGSTVTVSF